jgi:hypothetical protein
MRCWMTLRTLRHRARRRPSWMVSVRTDGCALLGLPPVCALRRSGVAGMVMRQNQPVLRPKFKNLSKTVLLKRPHFLESGRSVWCSSTVVCRGETRAPRRPFGRGTPVSHRQRYAACDSERTRSVAHYCRHGPARNSRQMEVALRRSCPTLVERKRTNTQYTDTCTPTIRTDHNSAVVFSMPSRAMARASLRDVCRVQLSRGVRVLLALHLFYPSLSGSLPLYIPGRSR